MMTEHLPGVETSAPGLWRRHRPGLQECGIRRGGVLELHYTLLPLPGESAIGMLERLAALLKTHNASVVRHEVFGAVAAQPEFATALRRLFGDQPWPVAFVEGASCNAESLAGMHVLAVVGARVESLAVNDRVVGRVFDDGHARPGHGLVGMRERVALYGGALQTGETADGGFAVSATLPLEGQGA